MLDIGQQSHRPIGHRIDFQTAGTCIVFQIQRHGLEQIRPVARGFQGLEIVFHQLAIAAFALLEEEQLAIMVGRPVSPVQTLHTQVQVSPGLADEITRGPVPDFKAALAIVQLGYIGTVAHRRGHIHGADQGLVLQIKAVQDHIVAAAIEIPAIVSQIVNGTDTGDDEAFDEVAFHVVAVEFTRPVPVRGVDIDPVRSYGLFPGRMQVKVPDVIERLVPGLGPFQIRVRLVPEQVHVTVHGNHGIQVFRGGMPGYVHDTGHSGVGVIRLANVVDRRHIVGIQASHRDGVRIGKSRDKLCIDLDTVAVHIEAVGRQLARPRVFLGSQIHFNVEIGIRTAQGKQGGPSKAFHVHHVAFAVHGRAGIDSKEQATGSRRHRFDADGQFHTVVDDVFFIQHYFREIPYGIILDGLFMHQRPVLVNLQHIRSFRNGKEAHRFQGHLPVIGQIGRFPAGSPDKGSAR